MVQYGDLHTKPLHSYCKLRLVAPGTDASSAPFTERKNSVCPPWMRLKAISKSSTVYNHERTEYS